MAQSREQQRLGQEMNEKKGVVPGYLGLPDDAPEKVFKERLARSRIMHSSEGALKVIGNGHQVLPSQEGSPEIRRA